MSGSGVSSGVSLVAAVRAEWTKARTVRSTWWSLLVAVVLCVGLALLVGMSMSDSYEQLTEERRASWDPVQLGFFGLLVGQVALVVFGVLVVSTEYTTGTIRASLAAVPRRGVFLCAKGLVAAAVALSLGVVAAFGAFFVAQGALGEHGAGITEPGVLRAVLGAAVFLTMMCLFAMGVAAMLRSTALSLGIMVPLLFLNSQGLSSLPAIRPVTQYLPDQAGAAMMRTNESELTLFGHSDLGPVGGFLVLLAWVAVALAGGYVTLLRRDA